MPAIDEWQTESSRENGKLEVGINRPAKRYATDDDLTLVNKTPDEIRAETSAFSFKVPELNRRIRDDDVAQAFIQAHLYLDHVLSRMLAENVPVPRHLQLDRSSFSQKLQLVAALGLLRWGFLSTIKVVNSIRNKIAHQLEYIVQPTDEAKFWSTLPKDAGKLEGGGKASVPHLLRLLVVLIELERQERAFERIMRSRAIARARVVLDGTNP